MSLDRISPTGTTETIARSAQCQLDGLRHRIDDLLASTRRAVAVQVLDDDLTAIAALTGPGILVKTSTDPADEAWAMRTLVEGSRISITNPAGTAGNITIALAAHGVTLGTIPKSAGTNAWADSLLTESASTIGLADNKEFSFGATLGSPDAKLWSDGTYGRHLANYPSGASYATLAVGEVYYCDLGGGPIVYQKTATAPPVLNVTNWNTAYGWGNHADAGYLTAMADHGVTVGTIPKASGAKTWANSLLVETATGIGLGIATPDTLLHVWGGSAGSVAAVAGSIVTVESNDNTFMSFLIPDDKRAEIKFGCASDNDVAWLRYSAAGALLQLGYNDLSYVTMKDNQVTIEGGSGVDWIDFRIVGSGPPYSMVSFLKDDNRLRFGKTYDDPDAEMYSDGTYGRHLANYPPGSSYSTLATGETYYCDVGGGSIVYQKTATAPPVLNVTNWNTAYGWGNHASAGYPVETAETDYTASSTITGLNTTAASWIRYRKVGKLVMCSFFLGVTGFANAGTVLTFTLPNGALTVSRYFSIARCRDGSTSTTGRGTIDTDGLVTLKPTANSTSAWTEDSTTRIAEGQFFYEAA